MWMLIKRKIRRILAELFTVIFLWVVRRYLGHAFMVSVIFGTALYLRSRLGPWADGLGFSLALSIPALLGVGAVAIFSWAVTARAIEPSRKSAILNWSEDEMEPEAQVYELYPQEDKELAS
jgi:hypothetical protein